MFAKGKSQRSLSFLEGKALGQLKRGREQLAWRLQPGGQVRFLGGGIGREHLLGPGPRALGLRASSAAVPLSCGRGCLPVELDGSGGQNPVEEQGGPGTTPALSLARHTTAVFLSLAWTHLSELQPQPFAQLLSCSVSRKEAQ